MTEKTCLLLKPHVEKADNKENQREDIETLQTAIEFAGLKLLPTTQSDGVEVADIVERLIEWLHEADIIVIDANLYEGEDYLKVSPYLSYFIALGHYISNHIILVARSDDHLPVSWRKYDVVTLTYPANRIRFTRDFKEAITRMLTNADTIANNPVQEYLQRRRDQDERENLKKEVERLKRDKERQAQYRGQATRKIQFRKVDN